MKPDLKSPRESLWLSDRNKQLNTTASTAAQDKIPPGEEEKEARLRRCSVGAFSSTPCLSSFFFFSYLALHNGEEKRVKGKRRLERGEKEKKKKTRNEDGTELGWKDCFAERALRPEMGWEIW